MSIEAEIREIERHMDECRRIIDLGKSLERLQNNRDFKKVVLEGYFRDEAVRLVNLKGAPEAATDQMQASILKDIDAIGSFAFYLRTIERMVDQASKDLENSAMVRDELLTEGE